jgi:MYXO-CTERM domain-containing protein
MDGGSSQSLLALGVVSALVACSGGPRTFEWTASTREPIVNGVVASAYPEAALVDIYQQGQLAAYCSGSLIAPQVVLTAGHCVMGESGATPLTPDGWVVTLPYNGGQKFSTSTATVYDWPQTDGTVDPSHHDIGLVFLASPATVSAAQCPALATAPVASGSSVVNIGRIDGDNGGDQLSTTDLYVGAPVAVEDGTSEGYPYDYVAADIIQEGDSGGPDEVPSLTPHLIVAVNSGGGSDEVLARVDLLNDSALDWIQEQITAHGGPCAMQAEADGGSSSSSGSSGGSGSSSGSSGGSGGSSSGGSSGSGSGSSGGVTVDAGPGAGNDASAALQDAFGSNSVGCGCRVTGDGAAPHQGALALLAAAAAVGATVRRRRR